MVRFPSVGRWLKAAALVAAALVGAIAWAHPTSFPSALIQVHEDGSVTALMRFDVPAYAQGKPPSKADDAEIARWIAQDDRTMNRALTELARRTLREFRFETDQGAAKLQVVAFPTAIETHRIAKPGQPIQTPVLLEAQVVATLAPGAKWLRIQAPAAWGTTVMTVEMPYTEAWVGPAEPGDWSPQLSIPSPAEVERLKRSLLSGGGSDVAVERPAPPESGFLQSVARFIGLGVTHIVPNGLDHALFVLGLFLLSKRPKDLLKQVTAFTLAHSVTLGLSLFGIVQLLPAIVEPAIALSIVIVAFENLFSQEVRPWRVWLVMGFGLIHGLGFAGALRDTGLQKTQLVEALIGFNIGVEIGQLSVLAVAFALVGWAAQRPGYRKWVVEPGSVAIGLIALYWFGQRAFG